MPLVLSRLNGFLIADANASRLVDAADFNQIKGAVGQAVTGSNFRDDVNADGQIAKADTLQVKTHKGQSIP